MKRQSASLRLVNPSADEELKEVAKDMLQYNFEDFIPEKKLRRFQALVNASSHRDIIQSTAATRLLETKDGMAYHNAYCDLMALCRHFVYST